MKKETFRLDKAFFEPLSLLSDQQLGQLLRAIYHHQLGLPVPEMDTTAKIAYLFISEQLDRKTVRRKKSADMSVDQYPGTHVDIDNTDSVENAAEEESESHVPETAAADKSADSPNDSFLNEPAFTEFPEQGVSTAKVITRSERRFTLHLPSGKSCLQVSVRPDGRLKIRRHFARSIIKSRKHRYR